MRFLTTSFLLLGVAAIVSAQQGAPTAPPQPRFGVPARPRTYPQSTAKEVLKSAIEAAEKDEYRYLVAHLMDPQFVEARLADRAKQLEAASEADLLKLREIQRQNPERVTAESRIPIDPEGFKLAVASDAKVKAFTQLADDIKEKLADDPEVLKDLRRFLREGTFADGEPSSKVSLPDIKDRAVYFKKVGDNWYIENRQTEEKKEP